MLAWLLAALLFVDLGGTFQNASAFGDARGDDQLFIDIQVEVAGDFTTVVAHFIDPGDDQQTVALVRRGDGAFYGGTAVVERANLVVVFEGIRSDRTSVLSDPTDLVELGVDTDLLGTAGAGQEVPAEDGETPAWVWLALALVAGVLSILAVWAMKDYPSKGEAADEAKDEPVDDDEGQPASREPSTD